MLRVRIKSIIQVLILSLIIQGCASQYSVVEFEILEPATVEIPDHVNQLVVLNRAPISPDIWADQNQIGMDAKQLVLLDTLIVNNLFRGLLSVLRNSPAERFQTPIWLSDRRTDTALLEDRILTKREVSNICDTIGGDAIISLEFYSVGLEQYFDYYTDGSDEVQNQYYEVSKSLKWNIHLPESPRPFNTYTMVDTLFFSAIIDGEIMPFVAGVDMLRSAFYDSGVKYGSYLLPVWNHTSRVLFRGRGRNDSLKMAVKHTDEGDWESAYSIWKQLITSDDSTVVAKAYHNMAVYLELEDNLDSASIMLDLSLEHDTLEMDRSYREELDVRILNRKDIEKQLN